MASQQCGQDKNENENNNNTNDKNDNNDSQEELKLMYIAGKHERVEVWGFGKLK